MVFEIRCSGDISFIYVYSLCLCLCLQTGTPYRTHHLPEDFNRHKFDFFVA